MKLKFNKPRDIITINPVETRYFRHVVPFNITHTAWSFKFMVIRQTKQIDTNNCRLSIKIFMVEHIAVKTRQVATIRAFCNHYDKGKE